MFFYKFNLGMEKAAWLNEIESGISIKKKKKPSLPSKLREGPLVESEIINEELYAFCFIFGLRYIFSYFSLLGFDKAWKLFFLTWEESES